MKKFTLLLSFIIISMIGMAGCGNSAGNAPEESTQAEESAAGKINSSMKTSLNLEFPVMKRFQTAAEDAYDEYAFFTYKEKADIITSYEDQLCLQKSYGYTKAMYDAINPDDIIPGVSELPFFEYEVKETDGLVLVIFKYKNLDKPENCAKLHEKNIMVFKDGNPTGRCFEASSTFQTFVDNGCPEVNAVLLPKTR